MKGATKKVLAPVLSSPILKGCCAAPGRGQSACPHAEKRDEFASLHAIHEHRPLYNITTSRPGSEWEIAQSWLCLTATRRGSNMVQTQPCACSVVPRA